MKLLHNYSKDGSPTWSLLVNGHLLQFCWFWGIPLFHLWPYPNDKKVKTLMWRLAIGLVEIRYFVIPFKDFKIKK